MLNFLSSNSQKQIVGISLTPGFGLEVATVDQNKRVVTSYGKKKVDYNYSTREIQNYGAFKAALGELMDELKVPRNSQVYLTLPNIYLDFIGLPLTISDAEIKEILLSKAEEFYLFKKGEPVSGWMEVINKVSDNEKRLAYSSFQKSAVEQIKDIVSDLGFQIVGIESAYSASLRGLYVSGKLDNLFTDNTAWATMIINGNSFALFNLEGKNLIDYQEVPLALKSFSPEEAYQAIISSSSQLIGNHVSQKLFIISQTDDISAEALKKMMGFANEIVAVDSNRYAKESIIEISPAVNFGEANSITPAVIGATSLQGEFNFSLNVIAENLSASKGVCGTINIGGKPVEVTTDMAQKWLIMLVILAAIVFGIPIFFLTNQIKVVDAETSKLTKDIKKVEKEIKDINEAAKEREGKEALEEEVVEVDMSSIIDEIAAGNVTAISFYDSIATDIPANVWLTRYYNKAGDKIIIRGVAENIVDIYEYYKNLRIVAPRSNLILNKLEVVTSPDGKKKGKMGEEDIIAGLEIDKEFDRLYSFEISNTQTVFEELENKYNIITEDKVIDKQAQVDYSVEDISQQMHLAR